jgi:hypothetical protein
MSGDTPKEITFLAEKARLFDEFPPDAAAITEKLQALALQVELTYQALKAADVRVGTCPLDGLDGAIRALEFAGGSYHERLREFVVVHALIRNHVSGPTLLPSWKDYAKRYHEEVESRHDASKAWLG